MNDWHHTLPISTGQWNRFCQQFIQFWIQQMASMQRKLIRNQFLHQKWPLGHENGELPQLWSQPIPSTKIQHQSLLFILVMNQYSKSVAICTRSRCHWVDPTIQGFWFTLSFTMKLMGSHLLDFITNDDIEQNLFVFSFFAWVFDRAYRKQKMSF